MPTAPSASSLVYAPELPALVAPVLMFGEMARPSEAAPVSLAANTQRMMRCIVPRSGTLVDLSIYVSVQSGNIICGVYDTGDASPGNRTSLYNTGSIACPAAGAWAVVGQPNLSVYQGQHLDIGVMADNAVATFPGQSVTTALTSALPTNSFFPCVGGAQPKLTWSRAPGSFTWNATASEAQCAASGTVVFMVARVA